MRDLLSFSLSRSSKVERVSISKQKKKPRTLTLRKNQNLILIFTNLELRML